MSNTIAAPRTFLGSIIKIRVPADSNSSGLCVIENNLPYGFATPLHVHINQDEIFHLLRGRVRIEIGDETFVAQAGDIRMAPKGTPHRFVVDSAEGADAVLFTGGKDLENFVMECSVPAETDALPQHGGPLAPPSEHELQALEAAAQRNNIKLTGPPLAPFDANKTAT